MNNEQNNLSNSKKRKRIMDEVIVNKTIAPFTSRAI